MRLIQEWMNNHGGDGADLNSARDAFKDVIPKIEEHYGVKVILAYVRGSHMYGMARPKSDVDITLVYQQPTQDILKTDYIPMIDFDGKNNIVGYEIQNYLMLLSKNNPNILESLDIPENCLIYRAPEYDRISSVNWLTKLTEKTILGYADSQIKKATGLEKNMNNPQPKRRKSILEFCYVIKGHESEPLVDWLLSTTESKMSIDQLIASTMFFGVSKVQNGKGLYALYVGTEEDNMRGILASEDSTQLRLSSIPKDIAENNFICVFYYNQDGFESHCRQHSQYWEWVGNRNEERFTMNQKAGQGVDLKNMAQLFRLLEMAETIAQEGVVKVRPKSSEFINEIRDGKHDYNELMKEAESRFEIIKQLYSESTLPDSTDLELTKNILLKFRHDYRAHSTK